MGLGALPDDLEAGVHDGRHGSRLQEELHLPGFHLGQIQNVVDEREQVIPAPEDIFDILSLLIRQLAQKSILEDFRESNNGVERSSEFMGHVRQELGFHAAGFLKLAVLSPDLLSAGTQLFRQKFEIGVLLEVVEGASHLLPEDFKEIPIAVRKRLARTEHEDGNPFILIGYGHHQDFRGLEIRHPCLKP